MKPHSFGVSGYTQCVHETDGNWVPGGEDRRTASGPEGSSAKANSLGAQDNLVVIGSMDILLNLEIRVSYNVFKL